MFCFVGWQFRHCSSRTHLCRAEKEASQENQQDKQSTEATATSLQEVLSSLKHTGVIDHGFWKNCSATGKVAGVLEKYQTLSTMLCDMARFVQDFKNKKEPDVSSSDLKLWCDSLPKQLTDWVGADLTKMVEEEFLSVCQSRQKALSSAGLAKVANLVDECTAGRKPSVTGNSQQDIVLKIPKSKEIKSLVQAFLEAGFWQTPQKPEAIP